MKENLLKLSTIVRAAVVGACALLVLVACTPGDKAVQSETYGGSEVTIGLTYIPNVQFSSAYVADAQGTYMDNGVVPTIRHHGSHEGFFTALLVGEEDIVITSGDEAAVATSQGLDIVSVGQYYASYPGAVIVPEDSDIHSLTDLEGKTVDIPGEHGTNYYATRAAMQEAGLNESDVTTSSIGYTQQAALASGQVDTIVGFTNNDAVQMRLADLQIREITLSPTSTPLVSVSFITTHKWAQEHPEQACAAVAATTKATNDIAAAPQIALDATRQWDTLLTDEATLSAANTVLATMVPLWLGDTGTATGAQDLATWVQMVTFPDPLGELEGSVDVTTFATNDYVSANDSTPPQP